MSFMIDKVYITSTLSLCYVLRLLVPIWDVTLPESKLKHRNKKSITDKF